MTGLANVAGLAVSGDYLYWAGNTGNSIGRAHRGGSGVNHTFIRGSVAPPGSP
jgi:hypothetical protein